MEYQHTQYALGFAAEIWQLTGYWVLIRSGLSARFRSALCRRLGLSEPRSFSAPPLLLTTFCYFAITLWVLIWSTPIRFAVLALEHRYGFSNQSILGMLGDSLTQSAISFCGIPILYGVYKIAAHTPKRWWLWLWGIGIPFLFFQIVLTPILIAPLFNRFTPMPPGHLKESILALAGKSGISGAHVFVIDTSRRSTHVNAYVAGLGPTTRIVLNDTALQILPEDQILAMLGHEMGHYVEGHIWVQFAGGCIGLGIFLYLAFKLLPAIVEKKRLIWKYSNILDPAALPVILLFISLFTLIQAPIENAESRYLERRADAFGLKITHLNEPMARLFVGFVERDFSDPDPPALIQFWFGSHPPIRERIATALKSSD